MPARWFVPIEGLDPTRVRSHHLHAAVSRWFDQDRAEHDANEKPYAVSPVADDLARHGSVGIEVTTLTERAEAQLMKATSPGSEIRVGNQIRRVAPIRLMQASSWHELASAPPSAQWDLRFETPVTFRSGNRSTPLPTPATVLGGLGRVWERWSPLPLADLQDAAQSAWVSDVSLRSTVVRMPVPGKDGTLRHVVVSGALGSLTIRCDAPHHCRTAGALLGLAAYSGTGSMTLRGLGVTRVAALHDAETSAPVDRHARGEAG